VHLNKNAPTEGEGARASQGIGTLRERPMLF
jgi:hypothetical protein